MLILSTLVAFLASFAVAAPVDGDNGGIVKRAPGPSGTLVSPRGGDVFVWNGGIINVEYQGVALDWTRTRSINVHLVNHRLGYNFTLANDLATRRTPTDNVARGEFRIPRSARFQVGTDYQLQIVETQINPGSTSDEYSVQPFVAAAPFISITFAG